MGAALRAVLFDIDGTLVRSSSAHLDALSAASIAVLGVPAGFVSGPDGMWLNGRPSAGFVDAQCFALLAAQARVPLTVELLAELNDVYASRYAELVALGADLGVVVDGVPELLSVLGVLGVRVALATGNSWRVAKLKLDALGIGHFFEFLPSGGFGDVLSDRLSVVRSAVDGLGPVRQGVVLVGDTVADVRAGWANGLVAAGVTSGGVAAEVLEAAGAHVVLDSVTEVVGLAARFVFGPIADRPVCQLCGVPSVGVCVECAGPVSRPVG